MVETTYKVLLLGEGNFSYALARVKLFQQTYQLKLQLIATSFDS